MDARRPAASESGNSVRTLASSQFILCASEKRQCYGSFRLPALFRRANSESHALLAPAFSRCARSFLLTFFCLLPHSLSLVSTSLFFLDEAAVLHGCSTTAIISRGDYLSLL